ncbi:MAG: phosphoribosyltransferase [Tepidiforma sp.]|nr:MAG: phosphoribosyltransferase [Tepidiforma sp.]
MSGRFTDRREAGRLLGEALRRLGIPRDAIVLGLARGGVIVAAEVARALSLPLDVLVVRKLGVPGQPELAFGAIARGVRVLNEDLITELRLQPADIDRVTAAEQTELERRETAYRAGRPPLDLRGRTAILVDDGLATGASMRAAVRAVRELGAARIIVAVPVAPADACAELAAREPSIECLALRTPEPFYAVGLWYRTFPHTSDAEVAEALAAAARP